MRRQQEIAIRAELERLTEENKQLRKRLKSRSKKNNQKKGGAK